MSVPSGVGVVDDARARRRRRRTFVAGVAICAGIAIGVIVARMGSSRIIELRTTTTGGDY